MDKSQEQNSSPQNLSPQNSSPRNLSLQDPEDETYLYDTHTLHITCGAANESQVINAFKEAIKKFQNKLGSKVDGRFRVNLTHKRGSPLNFGFIFLPSSEVFWVLLGKNPDGSERNENSDDGGWNDGDDWADEPEPLLTLPVISLSVEQQRAMTNTPYADHTTADIRVERARVTPVDHRVLAHVLKVKGLPIWLTAQRLRQLFAPFAEDSTTQRKGWLFRQEVVSPYPWITITDSRVGFIAFDPNGNDAYFALLLIKNFSFTDSGSRNTFEAKFAHAFSSDRDAPQEKY